MRQSLHQFHRWVGRPLGRSPLAVGLIVAAITSSSKQTDAQGLGMPPTAATPPSLQSPPPQAPSPQTAPAQAPAAPNAFAGNAPQPSTAPLSPTTNIARKGVAGGGSLPQGNGQEHRVYDLRPYTGYLTKHDRPHQAVIDWVLRETGSDVWFGEPFGFMSADRDSLTVYHTPEMHDLVSGMVDRFVAGEKDPQVLHLRMMTVGSPNWRSRSHMLMQHVTVNSAGLQAWLLTKENAAIVLSMLRQRTDVREIQAVDMITHNGQTEKLASTRGRNYVQNIRQAPTGWPPYEPQTGEVQEGFKIEMSPLLSIDRKSIDCVIRADIDQVDKLVPVDLDLPLPSGEMYRARIEVPQVVSWRLNERFRWPTDMVLLLSCGVVASPERSSSTIPLLNLNSLTGTTAGRADALMFIEFRGRVAENLPSSTPQVADRTGQANRGRY
jgi:hypothetical protein